MSAQTLSDEEYDQQRAEYTKKFDALFSDPAFAPASLVSLITESPACPVPAALAGSLWNAAFQHTVPIENIVKRVGAVLDSDGVASLEVTGGEDGAELFVDVFQRELHETIEGNLFESSKSVVIDNPAIIATILHSVALEKGLVESPHLASQVVRSVLGLADADPIPAGEEEVANVQALSVFALLGPAKAVAAVAVDESYDTILEAWKGVAVRSAAGLTLREIVMKSLELHSDEGEPSQRVWEALEKEII